jgi:hypothetical protein
MYLSAGLLFQHISMHSTFPVTHVAGAFLFQYGIEFRVCLPPEDAMILAGIIIPMLLNRLPQLDVFRYAVSQVAMGYN